MAKELERWCGDGDRVGIVQRLGGAMMALSFVVIVVAYPRSPTAGFVYAVMVVAHALLYAGFAVSAVADRVGRRRFDWLRLVLVLLVAFGYAVSGPILMSAVAASTRFR